MGSYYIPNNNLKGESRILYIFTAKSLIFTFVGFLIGGIFYLIFGAILGIKILGYIFMGIFALLGYGIATIKIPTSGNTKLTKNVGGDSIDDIILKYILFKKNNKVYSYGVERQEPDYTNPIDNLSITKFINNLTNTNNTKEEK